MLFLAQLQSPGLALGPLHPCLHCFYAADGQALSVLLSSCFTSFSFFFSTNCFWSGRDFTPCSRMSGLLGRGGGTVLSIVGTGMQAPQQPQEKLQGSKRTPDCAPTRMPRSRAPRPQCLQDAVSIACPGASLAGARSWGMVTEWSKCSSSEGISHLLQNLSLVTHTFPGAH